MSMCACGGQGLMLDVFFSFSPSYSLKQGFLLTLELTNSARLAGRWVPAIHLSLPSQHGDYSYIFLCLDFCCSCFCFCFFLIWMPDMQIRDFRIAQRVLYWLAISLVLDFLKCWWWIWSLIYTKYTFYHWAILQLTTPFYEWIWQHLSHGTACLSTPSASCDLCWELFEELLPHHWLYIHLLFAFNKEQERHEDKLPFLSPGSLYYADTNHFMIPRVRFNGITVCGTG